MGEATTLELYVGNIDPQADEDLLWELFSQVGPVQALRIPTDRVTGAPATFAFVQYRSEEDAEYAATILHDTRLFGRSLRINRRQFSKGPEFQGGAVETAAWDKGAAAPLFVGNVDPVLTAEDLSVAFTAFGPLTQLPKLVFPEGKPCGHAFVSYRAYADADAAIAAMNGQYLGGRCIRVDYANRKGGGTDGAGKYGSGADRQMAARAPPMGPMGGA